MFSSFFLYFMLYCYVLYVYLRQELVDFPVRCDYYIHYALYFSNLLFCISMKKILSLVALCALCMLSETPCRADQGDPKHQIVMTDCGSVYKIPSTCTTDEAVFLIDFYSDKDCGTHHMDKYRKKQQGDPGNK